MMLLWHQSIFGFTVLMWIGRAIAGTPSGADDWFVKAVDAAMAGPQFMYAIIFITMLMGAFDFNDGFDGTAIEYAFYYALLSALTSYWQYRLTPSI